MKYASIVGLAVVAVNLCSPAWAGRGNALAGGWDGTLTQGNAHADPAVHEPARATAHAPGSTSIFNVEVFAGPVFGSGGSGPSGNSGGAPSPEVNAVLSLILAGGTMAILRRRRTRNAEPQA